MSRQLTSILLLSALAAPALLRAQDSTRARPDTARLGAVVVTATKGAAVPAVAATTVLDGAELRARGVASVADALRQVAGVHLAGSGTRGAATSLFVRGGQSNYVKVLLDGVPLNEAGGYIDLANVTTDDIERIEIVRGPASVLYGSDAVTGVVQLFTRRGAPTTVVDAALRAGATGRKQGRLDAGPARGGSAGAFDATVEARGSASRLGWSLGAAQHAQAGVLAFNNDWRNSTVSGALSLAPDAVTTLRLAARHVDARYEYPTNGSGHAVDSNAVHDERRTVLSLEGSRALGARATLTLAGGAQKLHGLSDDQPDSPGDSLGYYYRTVGDNFRRTGEARLELRAASWATVTGGVEGAWQGETSHGTSRFAAFPGDPTTFDERRSNVGWYAQSAGTARRLAYTLGARVDDNEKFGTFGTWRASAAWSVAPRARIRAGAGTAFKEPAFGEVFSTAFTSGNADLRPERSRSWEVGADAAPAAWLTLGATWFDQRFRDMIQYKSQPFGSTTPNYFNVARATARGLEVEARTDAARVLSAAASFTALRTRVDEAGFDDTPTANLVRGERLLRRPDHQASVALAWRAAPRARLGAAVTYVGDRDDRSFDEDFTTAAVTLDAYTRVDLSAEVGLLGRADDAPLALTLRVENAANAAYEEIRNYASPGRVLFVGVRARAGR